MKMPMCGKCLKPVERLEEYYDDFMRRVVYTACCHGERERVVIEEAIIESRLFDISTAGVAFLQPRQLSE